MYIFYLKKNYKEKTSDFFVNAMCFLCVRLYK